jgi:hypothetical protein
MVKDRDFVVGGFPKHLAENCESLDNSRHVSVFSVSSRCLVCITGIWHVTHRFVNLCLVFQKLAQTLAGALVVGRLESAVLEVTVETIVNGAILFGAGPQV